MRRVKIGVIGCGAIAQVHHMPNLKELQDEFEVTAVCDVSEGAAQYVANRFHVPQYFTDYRDLLASDVEAVILCQTDPKKGVAVDAFDAGKHAFVEKPVCFSVQECDEMIEACKRAGTVGQAGYMKVYDPAFERAKQEAADMDVRFVQINHLHPNNALHLQQFDVRSFGDLPEGAIESAMEGRQAAREQAIGDAPPHVERAFPPAGGKHDSRPVRLARDHGTSGRGVAYGDLAGGSCGNIHAGIRKRRALRGHLDRSARSVGFQGDAGDLRRRQAGYRRVPDRFFAGHPVDGVGPG